MCDDLSFINNYYYKTEGAGGGVGGHALIT